MKRLFCLLLFLLSGCEITARLTFEHERAPNKASGCVEWKHVERSVP